MSFAVTLGGYNIGRVHKLGPVPCIVYCRTWLYGIKAHSQRRRAQTVTFAWTGGRFLSGRRAALRSARRPVVAAAVNVGAGPSMRPIV